MFSFHATKLVNCFEGGAIATNDDVLAAELRLMRNFGFIGTDNVARVGTNAKLSEICAAMGLTSLEAVDALIETNRENYVAYAEVFDGIRGCRLIRYAAEERCNYQYVVVEMDQTVSGISQVDLIRVLRAESVRARRYFYPGCHRMEPYRTRNPGAGRRLPETERIVDRVICLAPRVGSTLTT